MRHSFPQMNIKCFCKLSFPLVTNADALRLQSEVKWLCKETLD